MNKLFLILFTHSSFKNGCYKASNGEILLTGFISNIFTRKSIVAGSLYNPKQSYFFNVFSKLFKTLRCFCNIFTQSLPGVANSPIDVILRFPTTVLPFSPSHIGKPVKISKNMAPMLHISILQGLIFDDKSCISPSLPLPFLSSIILSASGAIYYGVDWEIFLSWLNMNADPKSIIFTFTILHETGS